MTHEADSAQSPVAAMDHHVLHVAREQRVPVLVDLTSAPGRTMVFTRTKHGAKALARQLNRSGVPAVELHGNLSQGARTRNMDAFHSGRASTLVATDIAARGIHVDDVALVVHADPPAEHKAYLHRSGRTARAGASGTVITLMTQEQTGDVRALTRAAGIKPTITRIDGPRHPMLTTLAPGERVLVAGGLGVTADEPRPRTGGGGGNRGRSGGGRGRSSSQARSTGQKSGGQKSSGGGNRSRRRGGQGGQGGQGGRSRRPAVAATTRRRSAAVAALRRIAAGGPARGVAPQGPVGRRPAGPARHPAGAAPPTAGHGRLRPRSARSSSACRCGSTPAAAGSTPRPWGSPACGRSARSRPAACTWGGSRSGTGTPARS